MPSPPSRSLAAHDDLILSNLEAIEFRCIPDLDRFPGHIVNLSGVFVDEVWVLPPDQLRRFPPATEGMVVQSLQADGPAARAGIKKGEIIVAVDGQKVRLRDDFVRLIRAKKPGQSVELTVIGADGTGTRKVTVPIGKLEVAWPEEKAAGDDSP